MKNLALKIDIIIVNWNAGSQLFDCVDSIIRWNFGLVNSICIVDNRSVDDSLTAVENIGHTTFPIKIIRNTTNVGFAAACNRGAAEASADFLLFLNPDVKLFKNSLRMPVEFIMRPDQAQIGIVGIRLVDGEGVTSTSAARFPSLLGIFGPIFGLCKIFPYYFPSTLMTPRELSADRVVDQVIGAFFLIRRPLFEICGGFDERFFVYFEEVDLSLRARRLGYLSYYLHDVTAFHKGGGCSERVKGTRLFYSLRSRILYIEKHFNRLSFFIIVALTLIEFPIRMVWSFRKISRDNLLNTVSAYRQLLVFLISRKYYPDTRRFPGI
jgi:GT2 family glycosyltransferase